MNRTEEAYAFRLDADPAVVWWAFEPIKFRLAPSTFYTPDFLVQWSDGTMQVHEVKGHWEDDARVKIKVAAERFPMFMFVGVTRGKKGEPVWRYEEFPPYTREEAT
jgi:hypothetical protein